jgi:hypothetical protein
VQPEADLGGYGQPHAEGLPLRLSMPGTPGAPLLGLVTRACPSAIGLAGCSPGGKEQSDSRERREIVDTARAPRRSGKRRGAFRKGGVND